MELEQIYEGMLSPQREDVLNDSLKNLMITLNGAHMGMNRALMTYQRFSEQNPFYSTGKAKLDKLAQRLAEISDEYEKEFIEHPFTNHPNIERRKDLQ